MSDSNELPGHATILVHLVSPLGRADADDHIDSVKTHGALVDATTEGSLEGEAARRRWEIKNKYYTADVGFKIMEEGELESEGDEPAVIVLAPRRSMPPATLSTLLSRLASRPSEFEVALLVSYPLPSAPTSSVLNEEAWEDIAMEHGFEWVDLADGGRIISEEAEDEDEEAMREQGGVARVVAALHAHMWEGMVPAPRGSQETEEVRSASTLVHEDAEDDDDFSALGAPPLPDPRPFVPTPVHFPSTFLPSLARSRPPEQPAPPLPTPSAPVPLEFDDDFAPFVPPLEATSFPPLSTPSPPASLSSPPSPPPKSVEPTSTEVYRHPALAFPDSDDLLLNGPLPARAGGSEDEDGDGDEDLSELFEKLKSYREVAQTLGMEERRALAESVVVSLLGE